VELQRKRKPLSVPPNKVLYFFIAAFAVAAAGIWSSSGVQIPPNLGVATFPTAGKPGIQEQKWKSSHVVHNLLI